MLESVFHSISSASTVEGDYHAKIAEFSQISSGDVHESAVYFPFPTTYKTLFKVTIRAAISLKVSTWWFVSVIKFILIGHFGRTTNNKAVQLWEVHIYKKRFLNVQILFCNSKQQAQLFSTRDICFGRRLFERIKLSTRPTVSTFHFYCQRLLHFAWGVPYFTRSGCLKLTMRFVRDRIHRRMQRID